jgi:hypothetical protein
MNLNRFTASLAHLAISLVIAGLVYSAVRFFWYPGTLFEIAGGLELLLLIISVDVILGPLITLIIFKPGKWGLRFDLTVVAILQAMALAYGLYAIAESRPVYMTFVKDRFDLVRAGELADEDLASAAPGFGSLSWFGYRIAGAKIPKDPREQLKLMDSAIIGSKDIQYIPRWYVPYEQVAKDAAAKAKVAPLAKLRTLNPGREAEVNAVVTKARPEDTLGFLPVRAGKRDMSAVVDNRTGELVALLPLAPWEY